MTINTIINPLVRESDGEVKWVFPDMKSLETEYEVEYKHHVLHDVGPLWPTFRDFVRSCKKGHPMRITQEMDYKIANRSHTQTKDQLLRLIRSYRSYPEFRNEKTIENLYYVMNNGGEMDMPIILFHKGRTRIMSGNTRMDVAFQCGKDPLCLVVEY